jgi:hypothetical protein
VWYKGSESMMKETIRFLYLSNRCSDSDLNVFEKYGYLNETEKLDLMSQKKKVTK